MVVFTHAAPGDDADKKSYTFVINTAPFEMHRIDRKKLINKQNKSGQSPETRVGVLLVYISWHLFYHL